MAQVSSLPARTAPAGTDILYIVDPNGGADYKINLTDMNLAGANMALLGGSPVCSLVNNSIQSVTGWTSKGVVGDISHDAGSGTITIGSDGIYQLNTQIITDWAVNGFNLAMYVQGSTFGNILLDNYAVASNSVDYSRVSSTVSRLLTAGEILNIGLEVDGGAAAHTIIAATFDVTRIL